jgi:hypothetical protein
LATANWQESYGEGVIMFYDVSRVSYSRLVDTTKTQKPYRNSGNAYPLGDRRYSARHFRKEDDGTFTIWYVHRESSDAVIRGDEINEYYKNRKPLARVYPDNTLEFTSAKDFHQGERVLLSELVGRCTVHQVKTKGGTIMSTGSGEYPVFTGLRINLDTGKPVTKFTVIQPTLNRKRSNQAMKKYKEFLDTYPVFINALDNNSAVSIIKDMFEQLGEEKFMRLEEKTIATMVDNKHYLDAAMAVYLEASPWVRSTFRYYMQDGGYHEPRMSHNWQELVKHMVGKNFRKMMLSLDESVFDWNPQPEGVLKKSEWGFKLVSEDQQPIEM